MTNPAIPVTYDLEVDGIPGRWFKKSGTYYPGWQTIHEDESGIFRQPAVCRNLKPKG